jgi:hypothetical protein
MGGVGDQVLGVGHVHVGRLAVGQHQQQLLVGLPAAEQVAGVAQRRAHARGVGTLQRQPAAPWARRPRLRQSP